MSTSCNGRIGLWIATAIGVGGMVGGGTFAALGLAVQLAHGGTPMAFALARTVAILLLSVGIGSFGISASRIVPESWSPPLQLAAGGMIIFLAYEGFELVANTAHDVKDAARTLPHAYFLAVGFVIAFPLCVLVALFTVDNLPVDKIVAAKD